MTIGRCIQTSKICVFPSKTRDGIGRNVVMLGVLAHRMVGLASFFSPFSCRLPIPPLNCDTSHCNRGLWEEDSECPKDGKLTGLKFCVSSSFYDWLVVWNMTGLFSISYMGCHPSHWLWLIFFRAVGQPPTRWYGGFLWWVYLKIMGFKICTKIRKPFHGYENNLRNHLFQ